MNAGPFSAMGCLAVIVVPVIVLLAVVSFAVNPIRQAARAVNKTIDADNVIHNYEWFKRQNEAITAIESKIESAESSVKTFMELGGERDNWDREDKIEFARLNSIAQGLHMQRSDMVSEYNARSRMANRNIFKVGDGQLPERIPE